MSPRALSCGPSVLIQRLKERQRETFHQELYLQDRNSGFKEV